jgi:hypothetical protein
MKRILLYAVSALAVLTLVPTAAAANSITANPASPSVSSGVYFTIGGKGTGGRDYLAISVTCTSADLVVYGTRIFVTLVDGSGTSQTLYPPASSCVANLEAPQSVNKFRVLETIGFDVQS